MDDLIEARRRRMEQALATNRQAFALTAL